MGLPKMMGGVLAMNKTIARLASVTRILFSGPDDFDKQHGVNTAKQVPLQFLHIPFPTRRFGFKYQAVSPLTLRTALDAVPSEGFTFVDLGCGKGRALIVASEYRFSRIIGVDFYPTLVH
jgi:SAM-dependent methyltransferase